MKSHSLIDGLRICTKCGLPKPLGAFHVSKLGRYGRTSSCGSCINTQGRALELAKCEVVCANCHRIRTISRLEEARAA